MFNLTPEQKAKLVEKLRAHLLAKLGPEQFAKLEEALKKKKAGGN